MTGAVQELLETFDALTEAEKHEAAAQVLRRVSACPGLCSAVG
jgi:hypothetical protein